MATPSCPGTIGTGVGGTATCTEAWEAVAPFSIDDIDPEVATSAFAAGFVIVGMAWAIGWGTRALLRMLK